VTILIDPDTATVIHTDTGEVLSQHTIDPRPQLLAQPTQTTRPMATHYDDDSTQI
jgi:hypothetical protein